MGRPTNRQILTKGGDIYARKRAQRKAVEEVTFDKEARAEYLTGFHKRKLQRKENAQQKAKELEHRMRLEERRRIRQERLEKQEKEIERFNQAMKDINHYQDDDSDEEDESSNEELNGDTSKDKRTDGAESSDYSDWEGFDDDNSISNAKPILKRRSSFVDDDGEDTTVVIEDMAVDLSKSSEVLQESIKRAQDAAIMSGMVQPPPLKRKKEKKFRYLTKQERKMHRSKQAARHKSKRH